jgi:hypothetical protein
VVATSAICLIWLRPQMKYHRLCCLLNMATLPKKDALLAFLSRDSGKYNLERMLAVAIEHRRLCFMLLLAHVPLKDALLAFLRRLGKVHLRASCWSLRWNTIGKGNVACC